MEMVIKYSGYFNKKGEPEGGVQEILEFLKGFNDKDILVRMDYDEKNKTSWDEVDLFCKSLKISNLEITEGERESEKIATIEFNESNEKDLIKLFVNIGKIGNGGHTYSILIGDKSFYFDGDGNDRVIAINGRKLTNETTKPYKLVEFTYANTHKDEISFNEQQLRECVKKIITKVLNG